MVFSNTLFFFFLKQFLLWRVIFALVLACCKNINPFVVYNIYKKKEKKECTPKLSCFSLISFHSIYFFFFCYLIRLVQLQLIKKLLLHCFIGSFGLPYYAIAEARPTSDNVIQVFYVYTRLSLFHFLHLFFAFLFLH